MQCKIAFKLVSCQLVIVFFCLVFMHAHAALDAPHNISTATGCLSCHQMTSTYPKLLPPLNHTAQDPDDTISNNVCWSCHYGSPGAPFVQTHSSLQTDNGYGDWTVECWVCHNQHLQEQNRYNGSTFGKYIRRSVNLANITGLTKTGSKTVKFTGETGPNSFADGEGVVEGICEICHTQTSHWRNDGTLAGVGVHAGLQGSNCMSCHPHDKGFKVSCKICHGFPPVVGVPQTNDGLVVSPSATGSETAGWHAVHTTPTRAYAFPCATCHYQGMPDTPISGNNKIQIGFSGRALLAGDASGTKYQGQILTSPYSYEATNGTTVSVDGSTTCGNIYCHSIGQKPDGQALTLDTADYTSPKWNETVIAVPTCSYCHQGSPPSGSHPKHLTSMHCNKCHYSHLGETSQCGYCHAPHPPPGEAIMQVSTALHVNREVNVGIISPYNGTYNGTPAPGDGFSTCSSTYCHGNYSGSGLNASPTWGDAPSGACGTCHGASNTTPPYDPRGDSYPTSQSHRVHAKTASAPSPGYNFSCTLCHKNVVGGSGPASYTIADSSKHIMSGKVDWQFDTTDPRVSATSSYSIPSGSQSPSGGTTGERAYGTCLSIYCHSDATSTPTYQTPAWGGASLGCDGCHGTGTGNGMPNYANGSPKANSHAAHVNKNSHPVYTFGFTMTCKTCHVGTTTDDTSIAANGMHVNHTYDLQPNGSQVSVSTPVSFIYTPLPAGGQCFNVSCHRGATVTWGGSNGSCGTSSCHLSPTYQQTIVSLSVMPADAKVEMNATQQFAVIATYSNNVKQDVTLPATLTSSDQGIAAIDTYGLATTTATAGTTTITATLNGVSGSTTLEVTDVSLVSITVTPVNSSLPVGSSRQFTATGTYSDSSVSDITSSVTWESSDQTISTIINTPIDIGLATTQSEGTATITARRGSISGSTDLTVTPAELSSIIVIPAHQNIALGSSLQFTATGMKTDGSSRDMTNEVTWSSADETVAVIDAGGLAATIAVNSTVITATDPVSLIAGSTSLTVAPLTGSIGALYPTSGANWNDYVKNDGADSYSATDTACDGTEPAGYNACLHGGEMRTVEVTGKSDCTDLVATDALGAFNWSCDMSVNPVRMVSTGLRDGKYLSDLIDFTGTPAWKANSVVVSESGTPYLATTFSAWWDNPLVTSNSGGDLTSAGTVYIATANPNANYSIKADRIAFVVQPPIILNGTGASGYVVDASANPTYKFLWVEGKIYKKWGTGGVNLSNTRYSVIRNMTFTGESGFSRGVNIYNSYGNKLSDISVSKNGEYGIYIYQSTYNILNNITAFQNSNAGIHIQLSSNNSLFNINTFTNSSYGINILSSSNNAMSNVISSNNLGTGAYLNGSTNNTFNNMTATNNKSETGIYIYNNSNNNKFTHVNAFNNFSFGILIYTSSNNILNDVTGSNNGSSGIYMYTAGNNTIANATVANNGMRGLFLNTSANNTFENIASAHNSEYGIRLQDSSSNTFTGLLKVGNYGSGNCYTSGGANPGLVNATCANNGASNATLTTGITLASSFTAKVTGDAVNLHGATGTETYDNITDWTGFETIDRGWGLDHLNAFPDPGNRGICSPGKTCHIWDWSNLAADTVVRGVLAQHSSGNPADSVTHTWYVNPAPTDQAGCNVAVPGSIYAAGTCRNTFLRNAVEITGNSNALCESNETCLYTPNIGSYQGHGPLAPAGPFTNGTALTGITLQQYGINGR